MNGGLKTALLMTGVALAGCSTANNGVKVRAIADPSATLLNGGDALAVARAQLMLGNVGLALEGFRKRSEQIPTTPPSSAGSAIATPRWAASTLPNPATKSRFRSRRAITGC